MLVSSHAKMLIECGRLSDARDLLTGAANKDDRSGYLDFGLSLLRFYSNQLSDSELSVRKAISADPWMPIFRFHLARVQLTTGYTVEAAAGFQDALSLYLPYPWNIQARILLMSAQNAEGEAAAALLRSAEAFPWRADARFWESLLWERKGESERAMAAAQSAVKAQPAHGLFVSHCNRLEEKANRGLSGR
jgi:tetratricopeptide (TPR) repeat protein